jgi:hypothetical protein
MVRQNIKTGSKLVEQSYVQRERERGRKDFEDNKQSDCQSGTYIMEIAKVYHGI